MQFQELKLTVAYENYGGSSEALDTVLWAIEQACGTFELAVLNYSARDLGLVPIEEVA